MTDTAHAIRPVAAAQESKLGAAWVVWPILSVVVTVVLALTRLVLNRSFYFADDSQLGAYGQWWELGDRLLNGSLPMLSPQAWQAGNYWAEGQWGLLNPVTWLVAVLARSMDDPVTHVTIVKVAFLGAMALGVYLLARSFDAAPAWAAVAGVLAPLGGFTVYMDAPSWATGLFNAALLPWAWWGLRRLVEAGRGPIAFLVSAYLLVTFGYVFGVMVLVVVLVESLVRSMIRRDRPAVLRTLLASAFAALVTIAVYLPGVLTASVTERGTLYIANEGFLNADLSDIGSSATATATGSIGAWWGFATNGPLAYVAWVLPLLALMLPVSRRTLVSLIPTFVVGGAILLVVIGPSHLGPIRWPIRLIPYVVICAVVVFAVIASHSFPQRVGRRQIIGAVVALAGFSYLALANSPGGWKGIFAAAAVQAAAIAALAAIALARRPGQWRVSRSVLGVGAVLAVTVILSGMTTWIFPRTPLPVNAVPDSAARMQEVLSDGVGDGIVVGDVYGGSDVEASFDERLMANLWYLSPTPVSSLYTVLPYSTFSRDLCMDLRGSTCEDAFDTLVSTDKQTGLPVADLLSVSTIVAMKSTYPVPPLAPDGWTLSDEGEFATVYTRTDAVPAAGSVVWSDEGTEVSVVSQDETGVELRVEATGAEGLVTLSRLAWPGYSISGATSAPSVRDYLLTVDVSDVEPGDTVVVQFRPPGWTVEVSALILAGLLAVAWPVLRVIRRRRTRTGRTATA